MSLAQLEGVGIGRTVVSRWVAERRLHRVHPSVYAVGHPALALEGRLAAALFYAGTGSALASVTAASWLGILPGTPKRLHVVTHGKRHSLPGVKVYCRRRVERIWHKRLPVTPPAQALLDIATEVRFQQLRRALAEAEFLRLVTLAEVEQVLGRGKPGSAALRVALDCHRPQLARTKKGTEEAFLLLCERYGFVLPDVNVWVAGWRVDAVWFEQKVVVELDSLLAHGTPARIENDHRRDLDLRAAGFTVLRYTWQQVTGQAALVAADLGRHGVAPRSPRLTRRALRL